MQRISLAFPLVLALLALFATAALAVEPADSAAVTPDQVEAPRVEAVQQLAVQEVQEVRVQTLTATLDTGLPGLPLEQAAGPKPNLQCPASCTGSNLTYVEIRDCYHDQCLHACKIYRDNSTGVLCATQCYAY